MTRSVTIVNTSNWEHEDVDVTVASPGKGNETTTLKPGEKVVCGPYSDGQAVAVMMGAVTPQTPVPFKDAEGNQDWPRVEVHKPTPADG